MRGKRGKKGEKLNLDEDEDDYYDDYYDEDEEDGDEYDMEDSDDDEGTATTRRTGNVTGPTVVPRAPAQGQLAHPPPVPAPAVSHPIPLTTVKPDLRLGQAAVDVFSTAGFNLQRELGWQSAVGADTAKMKAFRLEVTQQGDVTPFGFMRPSSPFIQVVELLAIAHDREASQIPAPAPIPALGARPPPAKA